MRRRLVALLLVAAAAMISFVLIPANRPRLPEVRKEREGRIRIAPRAGLLPRLEVPAVTTAPGDAAVAGLAASIGDVLRADLEFEEAFEFLATDSTRDADGADGVLSVSLRRDRGELHLEVRLRDARTGQMAFGREFVGREQLPRLIAHVAANELLADQAGIRGLAHSRLAFVSDRMGSFREPTGSIRRVKEIFVADYDGANEQRLTTDGDLDMTPAWSPDGRAVAYTSFRRGFQDLFFTRVDDRRSGSFAGLRGQNRLPAWSPDGTRIAFSSNRDGNEEIYVMNADGSGARRLTNHWAIDTAPSWSPRGTEIAFTSDRSGRPQIWVMNADGGQVRQLTAEKVLRPAHLVAGTDRRDRVRVADEDGLRHQGDRAGHRRGSAADVRAPEREPRVLTQRPPHRVHLDARRHTADLGHDAHRDPGPPGHARRQQLDARLVQVA